MTSTLIAGWCCAAVAIIGLCSVTRRDPLWLAIQGLVILRAALALAWRETVAACRRWRAEMPAEIAAHRVECLGKVQEGTI